MYVTDDNSIYSGRPNTDSQFYYIANGRWKNGQSLTFGGNGTNLSNPVCKYVYPLYDNSVSILAWTEDTTGNIPGKRFGVLNLAPVQLNSGSSRSYLFALSFVEDYFHSFKQKDSFCLTIMDDYNAGQFTHSGESPKHPHDGLHIFPNPFINGVNRNLNIDKEFTGTLIIRDNVNKLLCEIPLINQTIIPILDLGLSEGVYYLTFKKLNSSSANISTLIIQ
jgi:hypothetical protein